MIFSKAQVRAFEKMHADFAKRLAEHYTEFMGAIVDADIAFVDQTTLAEVIESWSKPSVSYTFTMDPLDGPCGV